MKYLTDEMISFLLPAETSSLPSPVPTQIVSSDAFEPAPQSARQREVETRLKDMSDRPSKRQGTSRRTRVNQDRFAAIKADYQMNGPGRSNLRYGYVAKAG
jgi:hypothetical protein